MADSSNFIFRPTEKFADCHSKHGTSCMVSFSPIYFVNIEVWVEAENALGKVSSEAINFDPVDKGTYKPEFESLSGYLMVCKLLFRL